MFSLIGNVIVLDIHGRDIRIEKDMPKWFEKLVCVYLARLFRMKKMNFEIEDKIEPEEKFFLVDQFESSTRIDTLLLKRIINIEKSVSNIWNEINERAREETKEIKWKFAAIVMDRLFFWLSIIYFLITFIPIILSIKNLYKST